MVKKTFPFLCLLAVALLTGCTSGNKFAASFGKRKYMKGYYMDKPSGAETALAQQYTRGTEITLKPSITAKQVIPTAHSNERKETNAMATGLVKVLLAEPIVKSLVQDKKVEKSIQAITGDDYRNPNVTTHKRISGGLLFAIIFLSAIAVLIILAVIIVTVSFAAKAALLIISLVLLLVAIAMLITVATNSNISGDVAGPVIEVLIDAFFAILGGIR